MRIFSCCSCSASACSRSRSAVVRCRRAYSRMIWLDMSPSSSCGKTACSSIRSAVPYSITLREVLAADREFLWFMLGVTLLMSVAAYFTTPPSDMAE